MRVSGVRRTEIFRDPRTRNDVPLSERALFLETPHLINFWKPLGLVLLLQLPKKKKNRKGSGGAWWWVIKRSFAQGLPPTSSESILPDFFFPPPRHPKNSPVGTLFYAKAFNVPALFFSTTKTKVSLPLFCPRASPLRIMRPCPEDLRKFPPGYHLGPLKHDSEKNEKGLWEKVSSMVRAERLGIIVGVLWCCGGECECQRGEMGVDPGPQNTETGSWEKKRESFFLTKCSTETYSSGGWCRKRRRGGGVSTLFLFVSSRFLDHARPVALPRLEFVNGLPGAMLALRPRKLSANVNFIPRKLANRGLYKLGGLHCGNGRVK